MNLEHANNMVDQWVPNIKILKIRKGVNKSIKGMDFLAEIQNLNHDNIIEQDKKS